MIANRGLQNSAATAAAAEEESAGNKIAQEDRKPLGCGMYNNFRVNLIFAEDMYSIW